MSLVSLLYLGQQEKNQDASGLGSRKFFEKALQRFSTLESLDEKLQPTIILEADSTTLSSEHLLSATGTFLLGTLSLHLSSAQALGTNCKSILILKVVSAFAF